MKQWPLATFAECKVDKLVFPANKTTMLVLIFVEGFRTIYRFNIVTGLSCAAVECLV